jgi:hypothetical protein
MSTLVRKAAAFFQANLCLRVTVVFTPHRVTRSTLDLSPALRTGTSYRIRGSLAEPEFSGSGVVTT